MNSDVKLVTGLLVIVMSQVVMMWPPHRMVFWQLLGMRMFLDIVSRFAVCWSLKRCVASYRPARQESEVMSVINGMIDTAEQIPGRLLKDLFFSAVFAWCCATIPGTVSAGRFSLAILPTEILLYVYALVMVGVVVYAIIFPFLASNNLDAARKSSQHGRMMPVIVSIFMVLVLITTN